jgi:hypothetical protein
MKGGIFKIVFVGRLLRNELRGKARRDEGNFRKQTEEEWKRLKILFNDKPLYSLRGFKHSGLSHNSPASHISLY